ncbi:uncharacterized protein Z518_07587 [Rhinocladiella mackenziei CBS 650.93]|uniref:INO80 complex subunit B-like conserved region domain-containing protein n=1 Tax=Rhinocladiella mackenziei CBS 650.93 TaxID=1442369 RepID=A0A0D2IE00_9EURO|nr:uncharacterized protein Z518_07587 [Rhinocladiella mackenziei CBS 650.93]KIX04034.1 hypothetical protein Z518_07587 [Rhinocladiella mackenziei CBS 650.93]
MTDRSRRVRRQISDATDEFSEESDLGSGEDYDPRRSDSMRRAGRYESSATSTPASSRSRRAGMSAAANSSSSATVQRGSGSADERRQSLKLTVKAPPSKLREVMRANEVEALHDHLGGGQVLDAPRSSRRTALASRSSTRRNQRPTYAEYGESDIDDEEDDDDDDEDEEDEPNDFDRLGAEPEGGTDDEDVEMEDAPVPKRHAPPKPPKITLKPPTSTDKSARPKFIMTPANVGSTKSVEDREMEDDPDDDEADNSSELSEEDEGPTTNLNKEDAEGEEEEEDAPGEEGELEDEDEDEDDLDDSSDETPASGTATPDLSRMTKRQRGRPEDQGGLMALDMAPQQRKFFTDEEKAMKKDEHARKRKELTKRKVQEEKTAALNRLLKPQVSKARGAAPKPETLAAAAAAAAVAAAGSPYDEDDTIQKANPVYTRWVSTKEGVKLGIPEEWLGKHVGRHFGPPLSPSSNIIVQEVE